MPNFGKFQAVSAAGKRGSALLATLCFAAVLSLSLSSYLAVCYRSLVLSNRGMQSTHSIELAEVGMEEALWALNENHGGDWTTAGWSHPGSSATKLLTGFTYENGAVGQVLVTVSNYMSATPQITAVGTINLADHTSVVRTLQSDTRQAPLFTNAIGATGALQFVGSTLVDSYNSLVLPYNPGSPSFSAVVSGGTVDLGTTSTVYGFASTKGTALQPLATGAVVTGPSLTYGIDPSRVSMSTNQPLFDVVGQSGTPSFDPITGFSQLTNSVTLGPGSYQYDSINLGDGAVLTISDHVVIRVNNSVRTSGTGQIVIQNSGSLLLQINEGDGQGLNLQGAGIVNQTGSAQNLSVLLGGNYADIDTPTSSLDLTMPFYGSIYLPKDNITVSHNSEIFGAMIGRQITFDVGNPKFHYDAALQKVSVAGISTFGLVQLREL